MKTQTFLSFIALIVISFVWTSCSKEGPAGPAGLDGNANVIATGWYSPSAWILDQVSNDWYFDVSNTEITADVVESGAILAYMSVQNDVYNDYTVRQLPAYAIEASWDYLLPNDGNETYGKIEFTTNLADPTAVTSYFRFIIIPSNYLLKSTRLKSTTVSQLKAMPYKEVCSLLGIKE